MMQKAAICLFLQDFKDDFYGIHNFYAGSYGHLCVSWWENPKYLLLTNITSKTYTTKKISYRT